MKKSKLSQFINYIRTHVSDILTNAVGTWTFVIIYSLLILFWIFLHRTNRLPYDTDLTYLNFFLCWLSGIQASIVMMSDGRKEEKHFSDTEKDLAVSEKTLEVDLKNKELIKKMGEKITSMVNKINKLEELIELMEHEEQEKINGNGNGRVKGKTKFRSEN